MIQRKASSPNLGMLSRPRLHALISDGLESPLLVMLAGPGYGKTQTMSSYLTKSGANSLWLRLTRLDNLHNHFWGHVTQALKPKYPALSQSLSSLGFPDTLSGFDAFTRLLAKYYTDSRPFIWVFDDFGLIYNDQIKSFFQMLVEMELTNFSVVLISNELASPDSIAFLSRNRFLILADSLRFTRSEIAALYQMYNLPLDDDKLTEIERHTEGWALALHLMVQQNSQAAHPRLLSELTITHMFEERFFSAYSRPQQLMLARLALLNNFTKDLAINLHDGHPAELEDMVNHPFFSREPGTDRLFWHHLYHTFLRKKQHLLTEDDRLRTWKTAAEHYAAAGETMEAITYYRKSQDHVGMLKAIEVYARKVIGVNEQEAEFLLEHLDLLTPQELREYPVADYFRAHIYMNILELEKSERLFLDLERRLIDRGRPDEATLLGDIYVGLSFLHMMHNNENYVEFIGKAAEHLPEGSSFYDKNTMALGNNNCFAMADNQPGSRERMEEAAFRAAPLMAKVMRGCMSGMEYIISAESAFMICDFEKARQQAYRGIYKAEASSQHDYVLNGYFVLSRISFLEGDLAGMTEQMRNVTEYASRYKIAVLEEIRDTLLTWYYMKVHDFNLIPRSTLTRDYSQHPLPAYGRSQIAYASYLTATREYAKLVGMLEHPKGLFLTDGIWMDRICLLILLAIGYHHLGNQQAALKTFHQAYDLCRHNEINALFIEAGDILMPLFHLAQQQNEYDFDPAWLNSVYGQSKDFVARAESLRAEYRKQNQAKTVKDNPLSKREREVLQALAQGLTREEIAHRQYISVNTVKAAIRSIYNKLAANNRAEAVSIALAHGFISGYIPK